MATDAEIRQAVRELQAELDRNADRIAAVLTAAAPEPPVWLSAEAAYGWRCGWEAATAANAKEPT